MQPWLQWQSNKYHKKFEFVFVVLLIQHAMRMSRRHLWSVRLCHICPHYLLNGRIFEKKNAEQNMRVLIFCTTLSGSFLILTFVPCPALNCLSTLPHKRQDFRKKKLLNKICVFSFSLYNFVSIISHSKKNSAICDQTVYWYSYKVAVIVRF